MRIIDVYNKRLRKERQQQIKPMIAMITLAAAYVSLTANAKTIEGQVFIVTAGGPAIKLALVQVKAISKIEIENHIAKIEQQVAPERAEVVGISCDEGNRR